MAFTVSPPTTPTAPAGGTGAQCRSSQGASWHWPGLSRLVVALSTNRYGVHRTCHFTAHPSTPCPRLRSARRGYSSVPTPACPRWLFSRACDSGLACARPAPRRGKRPATPVLVTTVPGSDEAAKSSQRASRFGVQCSGDSKFQSRAIPRRADSKTCHSKAVPIYNMPAGSEPFVSCSTVPRRPSSGLQTRLWSGFARLWSTSGRLRTRPPCLASNRRFDRSRA